MYTINKEKATFQECEVHHDSDGRELIPAEVQAKIRDHDSQVPNVPGYTVDDEGIVNAYTIEPSMYAAGYPTPEVQRRYLVQGAMATLLVVLTVLIAFFVD